MAKLTLVGERILYALRRHDECPMTPREIAEACLEHRRASDWAHGPLRTLHYHGFVETVGRASSNATTWRITDAGRVALASSGGGT